MSSEELNTNIWSFSDQSVIDWHASETNRMEILNAQRATLSRALEKSRMGHDREAEGDIRQVLDALKTATAHPSSPSEDLVSTWLTYAMAWVALGRIRQHQNLNQTATQAFKKAVALYEDWLSKAKMPTGQDYGEYGVALHTLGRLDEAYDAFTQAVGHGNTTAEMYRYLGLHLQRKGQYQDSIEVLQRAIALMPQDDQAEVALAKALEATGQKEAASAAYQCAASILAMAGVGSPGTELEFAL